PGGGGAAPPMSSRAPISIPGTPGSLGKWGTTVSAMGTASTTLASWGRRNIAGAAADSQGQSAGASPYCRNPDPIRRDTESRIDIFMRPLPPGFFATRRRRLVWPVMAALALGAMAAALVPRRYDAGWLLLGQDDPVALADRAVTERFTPAVAEREIEAALSAGDIDLANSFADLAVERGIALKPELAARLKDANSSSASAARNVGTFAHGLITGEPSDMVGLAGTAVGDLFVFGDIRDAVREGVHYARGEQTDEL